MKTVFDFKKEVFEIKDKFDLIARCL